VTSIPASADDLIRRLAALAAGHIQPASRYRGHVPGFNRSGRPLVAATDGSWRPRGQGGGFAYVTSDGHWAIGGWHGSGRLDPSGPSVVAGMELRAVALLLTNINDPLTVEIDSETALHYLRAWQAGQTNQLPEGYSLRPRTSGRPPTLVHLAETVAARRGLVFRHTPSHTGQPLNEAADALARLASRGGSPDQATRAAGLVEAFVRDWHNARP
jgi:ribonuclease HI